MSSYLQTIIKNSSRIAALELQGRLYQNRINALNLDLKRIEAHEYFIVNDLEKLSAMDVEHRIIEEEIEKVKGYLRENEKEIKKIKLDSANAAGARYVH